MMGEILVLYYSWGGLVVWLVCQIVWGIGEVLGMIVCLCMVLLVVVVIQIVQLLVFDDGVFYVSVQDLVECQGLLFGSLICFGNMVVLVKYFLDGLGVEWVNGILFGKLVGVFIFIVFMYGGQELILLLMQVLLLYYGCVIVGILFIELVLSYIISGGIFYGVSYVVGVVDDLQLIDDEVVLVCVLGCWVVDIVQWLV